MIELPNEVQFAIIEALGQPKFPDAYRLDSSSVLGLSALSRVSRAFQVAAEPLLYRRCFVTPTSLAPFCRAIIVHSANSQAEGCDRIRLRRSMMYVLMLSTQQECSEMLFRLRVERVSHLRISMMT